MYYWYSYHSRPLSAQTTKQYIFKVYQGTKGFPSKIVDEFYNQQFNINNNYSESDSVTVIPSRWYLAQKTFFSKNQIFRDEVNHCIIIIIPNSKTYYHHINVGLLDSQKITMFFMIKIFVNSLRDSVTTTSHAPVKKSRSIYSFQTVQ